MKLAAAARQRFHSPYREPLPRRRSFPRSVSNHRLLFRPFPAAPAFEPEKSGFFFPLVTSSNVDHDRLSKTTNHYNASPVRGSFRKKSQPIFVNRPQQTDEIVSSFSAKRSDFSAITRSFISSRHYNQRTNRLILPWEHCMATNGQISDNT